jgi:transcriptional regulator with XRE-family HTH domain
MATLTMEQLQERIRAHVERMRSARGWSQAELARRAKIQVATLSKMMRGQRPVQSQHLLELANAMDVDPCELVCPVNATATRDLLSGALGQFLEERGGELTGNQADAVRLYAQRLPAGADARRSLDTLADVLVAAYPQRPRL